MSETYDPMAGMEGERQGISENDVDGVFPAHLEGDQSKQQELLEGLESAKEIMGQGAFFGPAEIGKLFDVEQISTPSVPFSTEELRRASELGQFLILRIGADSEGNSLSMGRIADILDPQFRSAGLGQSLDLPNSEKPRFRSTDPFFNSDVPDSLGGDRRTHWALTAPTPILGSTFTNDERSFLDHAIRLARYLGEHVLPSIDNPEDRHRYELALTDSMMGADSLKYMNRLTREALSARTPELLSLAIVEMCSPTAVQAFYDSAVHRLGGSAMEGSQKMLEDDYVWTRSVSSSGKIVIEGSYGNPYGIPNSSPGLKIAELDPDSNRYFSPDSDAAGDDHYGHIVGTMFSRSK